MTRIAHISDLHFNAVVPGAADALLEAIHRLDPDLVIASGDFTMAARPAEFRAAARFLARIEPPVIATPGNHDIPAYHLPLRFVAPLARYRRYIVPATVDHYRSQEFDALAVNTARPWDLSWNWSHGRFSNSQLHHADQWFARAHAPTRALVMHHTLAVPDDMTAFRTVGRAEPMLQALERRGVSLVFSGHLHRGFWNTRAFTPTADAPHRSILIIQASTATSARHRDQPNAFNAVTIQPGRLELTPWALTGPRFEPQQTAHFERTHHAWRHLDPASPHAQPHRDR